MTRKDVAITSLIRERRPVRVAGRRFVVRAPTVGTVALLFELFPDFYGVLLATLKAAEQTGITLTPEAVIPFLAARPAALARVLATCVDSDQPLGRWPVAELAAESASMCNLGRVAAAIAPDEDSDTTRESDGIARLAREFRCAPHEVMDWPYEAFLEVSDARTAARQEDELVQKGFSPDFIRACRLKAAGALN